MNWSTYFFILDLGFECGRVSEQAHHFQFAYLSGLSSLLVLDIYKLMDSIVDVLYKSMDTTQQPKRRVAFVLIDGVGDVSLPRLGLKTPLEAANLPNLDAIAAAGVNGVKIGFSFL